MIIASDGLWDVIEDQAAVDLCKGLSTMEKCEKLVEYALKNGSRDNVSVLVIAF
jgi:serine/threonine protein phosphatase PrpC